MYKILKITDGTNAINLLSLSEGYEGSGGRQKVANYKGGGAWTESALSDGARLISYKYANVSEEIPLSVVSQANAQATALALADLQQLLTNAADYWIRDYSETPVWIEAQAHGEPATRYAYVFTGEFADIGRTLVDPFDTKATLADLMLVVTRGHWQGTAPKTGTALAVGESITYDGRTLGNVDDSEIFTPATSGVFNANHTLLQNLDHIYFYDASAALGVRWSNNLLDAVLPYDLLPNAPAVGDFVVFGIEDTGGANTEAPFFNLIFNLDIAAAGFTLVWQSSAAAGAWPAIAAVQDYTGPPPLTITGIRTVAWFPNSTWVTQNLFTIYAGGAPNINALWVRAYVSAAPGPVTTPRQHDRNVYTCGWASTRVEADAVEGHLPVLLKMTERNWSEDDSLIAPVTHSYFNRVIGGIRDLDRGANFVSSLMTYGPKPAGVTTALRGSTAWAYSPQIPGRGYCVYNPPGVQAIGDIFEYTFATHDFDGQFRMFAHVWQDAGTAGDIFLRYNLDAFLGGQLYAQGEIKYTPVVSKHLLMDLGEITLPGVLPLELDNLLRLTVQAGTDDAAPPDLFLYGIRLIPIDEFAFEIRDMTSYLSSIFGEGELRADSLIDPKRPIRSLNWNRTAGYVTGVWMNIAGAPLHFNPKRTQRMYFVYTLLDAGDDEVTAFQVLNECTFESREQFLLLRETT